MAGLSDILGSLFDDETRYNVPDFVGNLVGGVGEMVGGLSQLGQQAIGDPTSIPSMLGQMPGAILEDYKRRYTQGDLAQNVYNEPASFLFDLLDAGALAKGVGRGSRALRSFSPPPRLSSMLANEAGALTTPSGFRQFYDPGELNPEIIPSQLRGQQELHRLAIPEGDQPAAVLPSELQEMGDIDGAEIAAILADSEVGRTGQMVPPASTQPMSPEWLLRLQQLVGNEQGAMTPGATPGTPDDFLYHGTGAENLSTIAERGLDAGHWSPEQGYAQNFAGPEGAVLRSQRGGLSDLAPGETPGSFQAGNTTPEQLEMLQPGGEWGPLPQPGGFSEADLTKLVGESPGFGGRLRNIVKSEEGAIRPGAEVGRDPSRYYEDTFTPPRHAPMPSEVRDRTVNARQVIDDDIAQMEDYLVQEFLDRMPAREDVYGNPMRSKPGDPTMSREFKSFKETHPFYETLTELYGTRRDLDAELAGDAYTAQNYDPRSGVAPPERQAGGGRVPSQMAKRSSLDPSQRGAYWQDEYKEATIAPERTEAKLQGKREAGNLAPTREGGGRRYEGDLDKTGSSLIAKADAEWKQANPSLRNDPEYYRLYRAAERARGSDLPIGNMLREGGYGRKQVGAVMGEGEFVKAFRELEDYVAQRQQAMPTTISSRQSVDPNAPVKPKQESDYVPGVVEGKLTGFGQRRYGEDVLNVRKREGDLEGYEADIVNKGARRRKTERIDPMRVPVEGSPIAKSAATSTAPDSAAAKILRDAGWDDEQISSTLGDKAYKAGSAPKAEPKAEPAKPKRSSRRRTEKKSAAMPTTGKLKQTRYQLRQKLNQNPSAREIAESLGVTDKATIREIRSWLKEQPHTVVKP